MTKNIRKSTVDSKPTVVVPSEQMGLSREDTPLTIRLNFNLDYEAYEQLKAVGVQEATPIAGIVRQWIARGLRHYSGIETLHCDGTRCPIDLMAQIKGR